MSFLAWIVLGLIAGFIGSKLVNKSGEGFLLDIILGIMAPLSVVTSSACLALPASMDLTSTACLLLLLDLF